MFKMHKIAQMQRTSQISQKVNARSKSLNVLNKDSHKFLILTFKK